MPRNMAVQEKRILDIFFGFLVLNLFWVGVESQCSKGCQALASYYIWDGANLTFISTTFSTTVNNIVSYNPQITNPDLIRFGTRLNVPFSCGCINSDFMGHQFIHQIRTGNTYQRLAELYYSNLTTVEMLTRFNSYPPESLPPGAQLNVTVNCSCGNSRVSKAYGLFITYPLRPGESLSSVANEFSLPERLLQDYNPGVDFSSGSGLVFVPGKDQNGTYPPLPSSSSGISGGAIAGISVAAVIGALSLGVSWCNGKNIRNGPLVASASPKLKGITVDKSVEFTYEELAVATDNFNMSHKIGQGGFGAVYYAELRGEKAAVKKMDMQATKEFLAELKVLTHVHHVNLVRLIGYCVESSLFLVYEYIDNGNLSQHLRGKVTEPTEPLPWSRRLQIALDSARGLEYIHEHTVPVYIHRDIKSANILIDKNFRAKVAHLAKACTHENPQLRPSMRSIVVALMTLSSSTEDWDIGSFYENQGLVHLMSGRFELTIWISIGFSDSGASVNSYLVQDSVHYLEDITLGAESVMNSISLTFTISPFLAGSSASVLEAEDGHICGYRGCSRNKHSLCSSFPCRICYPAPSAN
ncbi:UNVERIFIED_CONTAM: Chitin elicitor receptor kinase [Sesamum calycinum]|uniref:Chitin elicitor receptor kinase n=1 Tax=Sesamum calycinum TaxID=2727403 RepID=A0AAW2MCS9_9LAMI